MKETGDHTPRAKLKFNSEVRKRGDAGQCFFEEQAERSRHYLLQLFLRQGLVYPTLRASESQMEAKNSICQISWSTTLTFSVLQTPSSHPLHVSVQKSKGTKPNNLPKQQHSGNCKGLAETIRECLL